MNLVSTAVRNNEFELKNEIQRMKDYLQTLQPGTEEYEKASKIYQDMLKIENESKDKSIKKEIVKIGFGALVGFGCMMGYRGLIENANEPFFKEFGKMCLRLGIKI